MLFPLPRRGRRRQGEVMRRGTEAVDRLQGPVVPVNICFADDHSVDYEAMRRYVDWLCEQRVPVILLTYGSSEFSVLSAGGNLGAHERFAHTVDGRALFVASTGYWSIDECREFLRHADAVGADAVKVQINPRLGQVALLRIAPGRWSLARRRSSRTRRSTATTRGDAVITA